MARVYNVIDSDGHILEPVDAVERLHGPEIPRPRAAAGHRQRRQGKAAGREPGARQPAGHGRHRRRRRAPGRDQGRDDEIRGRPPRRVRPAQAHPRHGPRRHRRRVPLSEHGAVRRRGARPGARRRAVPRLQPLARRLLQALSRPPVRHRDAADAVDVDARDRGDEVRPQGTRHARRLPAAEPL